MARARARSGAGSQTPFRLVSDGLSDIGLVRRRNEDAFLDRPEAGLWAVADGMGGHEAGDYASGSIIEALAGLESGNGRDLLRRTAERALTEVDRNLRNRAAVLGPDALIGSTVVVLMIRGAAFGCVWAGDSRLYRRRAGELQRLTTDHSQAQELIDAGVLSEAEARYHPSAHIVTQAIGSGNLDFGWVEGKVLPGDRFLLCSDGLTNVVGDPEIAQQLGDGAPAEIAARLRDAVLSRGAPDNVTIVIVAAEPAG